MQHVKYAAVVVAAGNGSRLDDALPKQYKLLNGTPVLRYTLAKLLASTPTVEKIVVAINTNHRLLYEQAIDSLDSTRIICVEGGATRQASVYSALHILKDFSPQIVVVHDAARPFAKLSLFQDIAQQMENSVAAICAVPVADTLKKIENRKIVTTVARENLVAAQTPQAFHFTELLSAHETALTEGRNDFTDDAMLMEWQGHTVQIIQGDIENFKITTQQDWQRAENRFQRTLTKSAFGYDVHAFTSGSHVMLGGISIPHHKGVQAHSDGDVVLHALTDAIFGLTGCGDIGTFFPPSDPQWHNANSETFVKKAMQDLKLQNAVLSHCDITVLAEAPKISSYRTAIIEKISALTELDVKSIGLKATTNEGLGFIGRGEGLAAYVMLSARFNDEH